MAVTRSKNGVGRVIRLARKTAGLTLSDVSGLVGISAPYLSNVENGNVSPSADWVLMVLGAIGDKLGLEHGAA